MLSTPAQAKWFLVVFSGQRRHLRTNKRKPLVSWSLRKHCGTSNTFWVLCPYLVACPNFFNENPISLMETLVNGSVLGPVKNHHFRGFACINLINSSTLLSVHVSLVTCPNCGSYSWSYPDNVLAESRLPALEGPRLSGILLHHPSLCPHLQKQTSSTTLWATDTLTSTSKLTRCSGIKPSIV